MPDRVVVLVLSVGLVAAAVYYTTQPAQAIQVDTSNEPPDPATNFFTGAFDMMQSQIDNLATDPAQVLTDTNVQAFLHLIRTGEGTNDAKGYSRLFGGKQFASYADHPRISVPFGNTYSTAAGAYQILSRTWDEMAAKYALKDFTPESQDIAAAGLIKRRGALADVVAGRFKTAIEKCNQEWASLPNSPYGQPTLTMTKAATILAANGGATVEQIA